MNEEGSIAKITRRAKQFMTEESRNKVAANKSWFTACWLSWFIQDRVKY
jgi:hypothetical protein